MSRTMSGWTARTSTFTSIPCRSAYSAQHCSTQRMTRWTLGQSQRGIYETLRHMVWRGCDLRSGLDLGLVARLLGRWAMSRAGTFANHGGHHRLTRQLCPDCNEETLHNSMACSICGHINLTPSQQRVQSFRRHQRKVRFGDAPVADNRALRAARRAKALETKSLPDGVFNKLSRDGKL